MLSGDCRLLLAADEEVLHEKEFDAGSQEGRDRLTRRVDDRLPFDVKARVQNHLSAGHITNGIE